MTVGQKIRAARRDAGMTLQTLAEKAGMSIASLSRIELGKVDGPRLNTLMSIAFALGVPVSEIIP